MIISKTPLRISFFGGGTDYPVYFEQYGGAVLSTSIDKYIYITNRYLPPFFEHKSRVVWSNIELVQNYTEIKHPSVRECLRYMQVGGGVEVHYDSDLPSRTGLGSSSSFTVGMLNSLYALKGQITSKMQLAYDAIKVEQEFIKENVGCQDQISAAFGGFNLIEFKPGSLFSVTPVTINKDRLDLFSKHIMLLFTGFSRSASEIAGEVIKNTGKKKTDLKTMYDMVFESIKILNSDTDMKEFGKLLHENWQLKRSLTNNITNSVIDEMYDTAYKAGAYGGKILGAGGGGFMLIFAEPELQPKIRYELKQYLHVPVQFDNAGSQIVFYHPEVKYD
jgi:D-glycero-alpha-D-manno-heptose-7-phosphate kinase